MLSTLARWLYSAHAALTVPVLFERLLWRSLEHPGWRWGWSERLALGARTRKGAIWLHAQTQDEVHEAGVVMAELRKLNQGWRFLLTHADVDGRIDGIELLQPGDMQVWLPFDTAGATRRFFKRHRPRVGLLMERMTQPNLLHAAQRAGVPMMVANALMTPKDLQHAEHLRVLMTPGFKSLALVLAQSHLDAKRLAQIGAQQVRVFGNLAFDVEPPVKLIARGLEWRQAVGRPVVLAAGTREGEEEPLLDAWAQLPQPRPLLIVVPRRGKRLAHVGFAVRERNFVLRRRSGWGRLPPADVVDADVWLGDTLGEMALYYGMADVALLGGSFDPEHGGQNLVEASACGCPVLIGPHTSEHENVANLAIAAGAAERVPGLPQAVQRAVGLAGDPKRDAWVRNAFAFTAAHRGTVNRVVGALVALVMTRSAANASATATGAATAAATAVAGTRR